MKKILAIFICMFLYKFSMLSKSQLNHCYVDSTEDCKQKILLNITVENSQKENTEKIEFVFEEITDQDQQKVKLYYPITLTVSQKQVKVFYKLTYRKHFSEQLYEKIISSVYPFCSEGVLKDDEILSDSTCGFVKDSEDSLILNSQGFCCSCPWVTMITGLETEHHRGNCGFFDQTDTAHCLVFSNDLYAAYQIQQYYFEYEIDINLKTFDSSVQKDISITETLSYNSKVKNNKYFTAQIIGNFMPSQNPVNLENQILLVPSFIKKDQLNNESIQTENYSDKLTTQKDIENFMNKIMVVNDSMISWTGEDCNKIGSSYNAFHHQQNKCQMKAGSCLENQIKDLYIEDIKRQRNNQQTLYLLSDKGQFENITQNEKGVQLKMIYPFVFTTQLTIEVDASDIKFTTYLGQAQILSSLIEDVYSEQEHGLIKAQIQNVSNYASSFEIVVKCSEFVEKIPSNKISLESQAVENVMFQFQILTEQNEEHWCELNVLNQKGDLVANEKIVFQSYTKEMNFESQIQDEENQKVFYGDSDYQQDKLQYDDLNKDIICQYLCPDMTGISCFIVNTCVDKLKKVVIIIGIVLLAFLITILVFIKCCGNQLLDFLIKLGLYETQEKDQQFQQNDIEQKIMKSNQYLDTASTTDDLDVKKRYSISLQPQKNSCDIKQSKSSLDIKLPKNVEIHFYKLDKELTKNFYNFKLNENKIFQFVLHQKENIKFYEKNEQLLDIMKSIDIQKSQDYSCFWYELTANKILIKLQNDQLT